ncbi:MAG: response regulator [Polynucleobacter sp.]|nr:response regulator [Polynucleobacter sp.]
MLNKHKHIFLIDDDASMRKAISRVLNEHGYLVEEFSSGESFLENLRERSPAVILLDMEMPKINGIEIQRRLILRGIKTPIIFVSGHSHQQQIVDSMKYGAVDFIFKPFQLDNLLLVISKAIQKDEKNYWLLQEEKEIVKAYKTLTKREKEVCRFLINGLLSKQIAKELEISNATVKVHKGRVMEKLKVNSLQDLVKIAIKHALH